jgi:hypothetical protein
MQRQFLCHRNRFIFLYVWDVLCRLEGKKQEYIPIKTGRNSAENDSMKPFNPATDDADGLIAQTIRRQRMTGKVR